MHTDPIIVIGNDGQARVGAGYTIGQVLQALDAARASILNIVLRPETAAEAATDST